MKVKQLIEILNKINKEDFIYLNFESNIEDEFSVFKTDAGNVVFVPNSSVEKLSNSQEFTLLKLD